MVVVGLVLMGATLAWLWWGRREPLLYLTPFAIVLPPLFAYGSRALGWPGGWVSTRVALTGCVLVSLGFRVLRNDVRWRAMAGFRWVAPYLALVVASALWSAFTIDVLPLANDLLTWLIPIVIFLGLAVVPSSQIEIASAIRVIGIIAVTEVVVCAWQGFTLFGFEQLVPVPIVALTHYGQRDLWFGSFRLYGTLPNLGPNFLGVLLVFPATVAVARAVVSTPVWRFLWGTVAIACIGVVLGTYSRGAQLGLAVSLLALPLWFRSKRGLVVSGSAIVACGFLLAGTPVGTHVLQLYSVGRFDPDAQARLDVWRAIMAEAPTHPLGHGFDGWLEASRHAVTIGDPSKAFGSPHTADNLWLRELADRGLPGVIALALLMGGVIATTYRACARNGLDGDRRTLLAAAGAGTLGWSAAFISGDHLLYLEMAGLFWYIVGLALPAAQEPQRQSEVAVVPGFPAEAQVRPPT